MNRVKYAFTLIEMLVVMTIIGVMAAIIIPMIGFGSSFADTESTRSYLKIVDSAIKAYKADFDAYPLQAGWTPTAPLNPIIDYWNAPADASRKTDTNNLAYALCHPNPSIPQNQTQRDDARLRKSYQSNLAIDKINSQRRGGNAVDFSTDTLPYALYDDYGAGGDDRGQPLIYIHDPLGVYTWDSSLRDPTTNKWTGWLVWQQRGRKNANTAGGNPEDHSAFTHAYDNFELMYELWSIGPDGLYDEKLHDLTIEENKDNITVTPYQ